MEQTNHAGNAPGRKDAAVDRAELTRTEDIAQISRHTGEATAIAADDQQHERLEHKGVRRSGELPEGRDLNGEKEHIGPAAADVVRYRRPGNAAEAVEQADDADHRSRRGR